MLVTPPPANAFVVPMSNGNFEMYSGPTLAQLPNEVMRQDWLAASHATVLPPGPLYEYVLRSVSVRLYRPSLSHFAPNFILVRKRSINGTSHAAFSVPVYF